MNVQRKKFKPKQKIKKQRTLATSGTTGITGLARVVSEDLNHELVDSLLELVDDSVVQGVLVLLKPSSDVVADLVADDKNKLVSFFRI